MAVYVKKPKQKPQAVTDEIRSTVSSIISAVERRGTDAIRECAEKFDNWSPPSFRLSDEEIASVSERVDPEVLENGRFAIDQVSGHAAAVADTELMFGHAISARLRATRSTSGTRSPTGVTGE